MLLLLLFEIPAGVVVAVDAIGIGKWIFNEDSNPDC